MLKVTVYQVAMMLLLLSSSVLVLTTRSIEAWNGSVTILPSGELDPSDAPIQRIGSIYTLTGNMNSDADGIIVQCDDIVIDGAGYTVQGTGSGTGIYLAERRNVTIQNMTINQFEYGIHVVSSSDGRAVGNTLADNYYGIWLQESSDIVMIGNNVSTNLFGIGITLSSANSIFHNNLKDNNIQAFCDTQSYDNSWDNGFPSGGNYWSDYTGNDSKWGIGQSLDGGGDGIGDTYYNTDADNISLNNIDNYPLMHLYVSDQIFGVPCDVNRDGTVDVQDVFKVGQNYGKNKPPELPPWDPTWGPLCDLNSDGIVDVQDYYLVCKNYGR